MADTLKEYLIALGFKVDENGWKGFNEKVIQSGKNVASLGATSVAVATEIGVAVEKVARHYEELFYVSQRTGSAVSGIKAMAFGFGQIGSSAEASRAAIEGMSAAARMNPGVRAMFAGMGVDLSNPTKAMGQLVDTMKSKFGEAGYFAAARYAAIAGVEETTFRQVWMNREKEKSQEEKYSAIRKRAGIDDQDAANKSRDFGDALRLMEARWTALTDKVAIDWIPVAIKVIDFMSSIADNVNDANVASKGWLGTIGSVVAALGALKTAGALLGFAGRLVGLGGGAAAVAGSLGVRGLALRLLGPVGAFAWALGLGGEAQGAIMPGGAGKAHPSDMGGTKEAALEFYKSKGWTAEQSAGIVANLHSESGMNHRAIGDGGSAYGLAQWHPDRQADFARWAGHDIRDSTVQEQLEFVHYELTQGKEQLAGNALRGTRSARGSGSVVSRMYERPADVLGAASNRGDMAETILSSGAPTSVVISHRTENNISGVSDPAKAASLVNEAQRRTNGDIVRNTKSLFN